jgi:hypothetical protein
MPLLLLLACGGDGDSAFELCPLDDEPTLAIGGGTGAFQALADGDTITLVHGPQGGYHLELGLRATGFDASTLAPGSFQGSIDGQIAADSTPWLEFRCNADTGTADAWASNLIYDLTPQELDNMTTEITASVVDASGQEFTAALSLIIDDPAY